MVPDNMIWSGLVDQYSVYIYTGQVLIAPSCESINQFDQLVWHHKPPGYVSQYMGMCCHDG